MNQRHEHRHGCGRVPAGCPRGSPRGACGFSSTTPADAARARRASQFPHGPNPRPTDAQYARLFSEAPHGTGCAGRCVHRSPTRSAARRTFPPATAGLHDGDHRAASPVMSLSGRAMADQMRRGRWDLRRTSTSRGSAISAVSGGVGRAGHGPRAGAVTPVAATYRRLLAVGERGDPGVDSRRSVRPLLRAGDGTPHSPLDATASPACECVVYWNGGHEPWMVAYSS